MWPLAKDFKAAFYLWPRCAHSSWWINANQIQWHFLICWMDVSETSQKSIPTTQKVRLVSPICAFIVRKKLLTCATWWMWGRSAVCIIFTYILHCLVVFVCAWRGGVWGVIKGSRACLSSLRAGSSHVKLLPQDTVIVKAKLPEPRFHLHWWNKHQGWISVLIKSPLCVKRQQR